MTNISLVVDKFVQDYFAVIKGADKIDVLNVSFLPVGFFEPEAKQVKKSFFAFAASEEAKTAGTESVWERFEAGHYDSIHKIFHDLTVISIVLLSKFKLGDPSYTRIDDFYTFSVTVLLSEASRLHVSFQEDKTIGLTEAESKLLEDYALITTCFEEQNLEAVSILANKNTILFSSLLKKSNLDNRDLKLEEPFKRTTVTPQFEQTTPFANVLGNLSPALSVQRNVVFDQITKDFFHPNWYGLFASQWLKNSLEDYNISFLPAVDGDKSVVSKESKGLVWFQKVGLQHVKKLEQSESSEVAPKLETASTETAQIEEEEEKADKATEEGQVEQEEEKEADVKTEKAVNGKAREPKKINVRNLLSFNASLDEEELYASLLKDFPTTPKSAQSKVSKLLVQLNKLSSLAARDLKLEKQIYFQLEKLLNFIVLKNNVTPEQLQLSISSKLPVTQNNYSGVLPGESIATLTSTAAHAGYNVAAQRSNTNGYKSSRLSSINKKYKR